MNNKSITMLIVAGALALFGLIGFLMSTDITKVQGNEFGVKETWSGGISEEAYPPRTYFYLGWDELYRYEASPQIFVMNSRANDERANGRPNDSFVTTSNDNQKMTMDLAMQWRFDPSKRLEIHKTYRSHVGLDNWQTLVEERTIRQNLMAAVNTAAANFKAIDAYSGDGFVRMQKMIFDRLTDTTGELAERGIIVDTFVIEKITLDEAYIGEISKRQVAQQRELRARQETLAANAEAERAKAEARTQYEQQVMLAEQQKQQGILQSEGEAQQKVNAAKAQAEQQILAAKAEAERVVLAANAERQAAEARAAAITAIGEAEAAAKKLNMLAYTGEGADNFVRIETARSMAEAFKNIDGYLPSDMSINMLSTNFLDSIRSVVAPPSAIPVK
jgi:regulator of protease activity HflC (stomatin/prohibitin superfamily)